MKHLACIFGSLWLAAVSGCGGDGTAGTTEISCGEGTSGILATEASVEVAGSDAKDLAGAALAADHATSVPSAQITISCADDIAPAGYTPLGPAVSFGPAGTASERSFLFTLPFKAARLPETATNRHVRIVAKRHLGDGTPFFPPVANRLLDTEDPYASRVNFRAGELVTYQAVVADNAGQPVDRRYTYRAIIGISMGGNAALRIGLSHHEQFDLIGTAGGDPGMTTAYLLSYMAEFMFGGFCTAADQAAGVGSVGELCIDEQRRLFADQYERGQDFEHLLYEAGDGTGMTLKRSLYMKGFRDMARAFGNPATYTPDNPYSPPGVPLDYIYSDDKCQNPIVLEQFYDREFNPDGSYPVITFCDGGDSPALGTGVFDPSMPQQNRFETLLAVDLNENGVRDSGEPIIFNGTEPFEDIGVDGLADVDEPGYDAATNPDPNGDNYHYLNNPLGTERNLDFDDGEPYDDVGLDGVADTCQITESSDNCYDYGEGNAAWDRNPNHQRWLQSDAAWMVGQLTDDERERLDFYADAGIRDFLNNAVPANMGVASLMNHQQMPFGLFDGFAPLHGATVDAAYDFARVDWATQPRHAYIRYGNPDASQSMIEQGDGRHAGTPLQMVNRVTTIFDWIDARWPNGDRTPTGDGEIIEDLSFVSPTTNRETPYSLFLPPGYATDTDKTYPVVYFLHGYGMSPEDLVLASAIFENYMINPDWEEQRRFQKMIIVYVDGQCRPYRSGVPVDPDGDGCEQGTWYTNAPLGGPAQMETHMFELMDYIEQTYRTRDPEVVSTVQ